MRSSAVKKSIWPVTDAVSITHEIVSSDMAAAAKNRSNSKVN